MSDSITFDIETHSNVKISIPTLLVAGLIRQLLSDQSEQPASTVPSHIAEALKAAGYKRQGNGSFGKTTFDTDISAFPESVREDVARVFADANEKGNVSPFEIMAAIAKLLEDTEVSSDTGSPGKAEESRETAE